MKWTLVTGGSKRLGAEICLALAAQGQSILVHYRNSKHDAESVVTKCRQMGVDAEMIQGDFSSMESTASFIQDCQKQYPDIKNLINNVGNYLVKSSAQTTAQEWCELFQTNLNTPFALCQAFLPSLQASKGSIINIGVTGINNIRADIKRSAYSATKMGLLMLTKSLAKELAPAHVRVNMVSPGYLGNAVDLPEAVLPMQRPASMAEVVRVIIFLLNEQNGYLTGQNIEVGGGIGL
nr:3-oxoacyl-[acyl-carrier-protein] reductase FabG [uncultured bacterium]